MAEHSAVNRRVVGSSPTRGVNETCKIFLQVFSLHCRKRKNVGCCVYMSVCGIKKEGNPSFFIPHCELFYEILCLMLSRNRKAECNHRTFAANTVDGKSISITIGKVNPLIDILKAITSGISSKQLLQLFVRDAQTVIQDRN